MNVPERAYFGRLKCKPDIDLDFNTEVVYPDLFGLARELDVKYYKR
jgi:hypothetical protein